MTIDMYKNSDAYNAQKKILQEISQSFLQHSVERKTIHVLWISCSSTNKDDNTSRVPSSHSLLLDTLELAKTIDTTVSVETKYVVLEDIGFDHCEANYSIQWHYCTWPCWISQRKAAMWIADPLTQVYNDMLDWADIVLLATPIRWGNASSLYYKFVERCNCIENQKEVYDVDLVHNKLMWMIIVWAQDGVQHVLGNMMATWSQMWFAFAKQPFVWYTSWWYLNQKVDQVQATMQEDKPILQTIAKEMLINQFAVIKARRSL